MTRFGYVMATYFVVLGIGGLSLVHVTPKLIWNASASVPIGVYIIRPARHLDVTELVAVDPPKPLADFLAERRYLPHGVALMKRIVALPGQKVCRIGLAVTVDGVAIGDALKRDRLGRPLPVWQGCRRIAAGQVFLMNWQVRDSLDSRYFGPIPTSRIIGRAIPLWTDEAGNGRFEWRAPTWQTAPKERG
jgi:conjugative transfer signal peptidase TraF